MRVTQKTILEAARRFAEAGLINSGALVRLHPENLTISVVEPSATSHIGPHYEMTAEAPRLYGAYTPAGAVDAWLDWMADVLGVHYRLRVKWFHRRQDGRRTVAKAIVEKLQETAAAKAKRGETQC